jgi:uncharacterized integral membrane protein
MRLITWLVTLPIFAAVIIFILQNRMQVSLSFWPFDAEVTLPVSVLSLGLLIFGFVAGSLMTGASLFHSQYTNRKLRKQIESLSKKVEEKTPLSCEPTILYNGRYQTVSNMETTIPSLPKKKRWFGKD